MISELGPVLPLPPSQSSQSFLRNPIFLSSTTASALPDDVLLEVFNLYVDSAVEYEAPDAWHSLIHVCQIWRCVVFAFA